MRDATLHVVAGVWLFGTAVVALLALACVVYLVIRRKVVFAMITLVVAAIAAFANPIVNVLALSTYAESCRERMLAAAHAESCVGRPAEWLRTRFGEPARIHHGGDVDQWWYTPGPWFIMHEDYVGFEVVLGQVTNAYVQVN